jgi:hypothetical protein
MSGHPPFGAQVMLNGHEYVACQAQKAGVGFTRQDNCFTTITSAAELAQIADTLSQNETAGKPAAARATRPDQSGRHRSQQAENAAGSRSRPGIVRIARRFHGLGTGRTVHSMTGQPESRYGARRAAYDIKNSGPGMVRRIGKSRRYEPVPEGLRSLTALLVLREKIVRPLLAAGTQPEPEAKPANPVPIDHHYERLRAGMRDL